MKSKPVWKNSSWKKSPVRYLDEFFALKCSPDVLGACAPISSGAKEITESMALVSRLRSIALQRPMELELVDACAGNGLTGVLAVHLLPFKHVHSLDRKPVERDRSAVRRYTYHEFTIAEDTVSFPFTSGDYVLCAAHPCKRATDLIRIYQADRCCRAVFVLLCCNGHFPVRIPAAARKSLGRDEAWALSLALAAKGQYVRDRQCLSPKNLLVYAEKGARP